MKMWGEEKPTWRRDINKKAAQVQLEDWTRKKQPMEVPAVEVGAAQMTGAEAVAEAGPAVAAAPRGQRPKPANWGSMTKAQRESWRSHAKRDAKKEGCRARKDSVLDS